MPQIDCPCCGAKINLTVEPVSALSDMLGAPKSRPAKSEYAAVRDTPKHYTTQPQPVKAAPLPKVPEKKYRTNTDIGAFRQALLDAGFSKQADSQIFNDKNVDSRRLKLWFGRSVVTGSVASRELLDQALKHYFGDRLISHGEHEYEYSYIVRLKL